MKLSEFLKKFNLKADGIISYSGDEAIKAVEQDGYALQYVKEQTPDICIKAVEQNGNALRYVDKAVFDPEVADEKPDTIVVDGVTYMKMGT